MPAREKLNAAYLHGSLILAAVAGFACSSWTVFTRRLGRTADRQCPGRGNPLGQTAAVSRPLGPSTQLGGVPE